MDLLWRGHERAVYTIPHEIHIYLGLTTLKQLPARGSDTPEKVIIRKHKYNHLCRIRIWLFMRLIQRNLVGYFAGISGVVIVVGFHHCLC